VVVLIYFINHFAKSIQTDVVINDVDLELNFGIEHLFPSEHKKNNSAVSIDSISADFTSLAYQENVLAKCSGYVQTTDYEEILLIATKSDSVIECKFGPGDFVVQGTLIAIIYSDNIVDEKEIKKISDRILLGACRTPVQDPEFAIHQLVEIALRALSPGINDPYSAITCVDKLNSVLCGLTERVFPSKQHFDQKGILRVVCKLLTFKDVATAAFEQIRQHANNNVAVTMRLLSSLHELIGFANTEEQKEFVIRQTKIIKEQQFNRSLAEADLNVISEKVELILSGKK
jgi:uncharacterized membrane protein